MNVDSLSFIHLKFIKFYDLLNLASNLSIKLREIAKTNVIYEIICKQFTRMFANKMEQTEMAITLSD